MPMFRIGFAYFIGRYIHVVDDFGNLVYLHGDPSYAFRDFYNDSLPDFYGQ